MRHTFLFFYALLLVGVTSVLSAQPANPPVGGNWAVVNNLTDNFSSFNSSKWVKRNFDTGPEGHRWRGRAPGEFHAGQSTVNNGRLRITATAKYDPGNEQTNCDFWMRTGFVYSQAKMQQGWYTECLMRASDLSMASSFWLKLGTINNQEIDITETYGNGRNTRWWDDKIRSNTHFFQNGQDFATNPPPIDVTNGGPNTFPRNQFYRVGMHWRTSRQMDIYVNGTLRQTMTVANNREITEPLRLIWDMEPFVPACGSGPGAPDYEHIRPNNPTRRNYMEVEWVKTWRPVAGGGGGQLIPNGTYNIKSPFNNQNLGAFSWNNHNARMINPGNFSDQKWDFVHLGNNVYTIRNRGTNRYLEVPFARCGNGNNMATWTSAAGNHQRWYIERTGSNYFMRPNHCRAQAADRAYGALNANVGTYQYGNNNNLRWRIVTVPKSDEPSFTPAGKGDIPALGVDILRNPTSAADAAVRVNLPADGPVSLMVYAASGQLIGKRQLEASAGEVVYPLASTLNADLPGGVYLVRVAAAGAVVTKRVMITR